MKGLLIALVVSAMVISKKEKLIHYIEAHQYAANLTLLAGIITLITIVLS